MRKTKHFLLMAAMLLGSVGARAAYEKISGVWINITSEANLTASVVYAPDGYSGDVIIPETIVRSGKTYRVTAIAPSAFDGDVDVTSVYIPESVTSIGDYAFRNCSGMKSINFPRYCGAGVYAFQGCTGELLLSRNVPLVEVGTNPKTFGYFYGSKFSSVIVDENVTRVGPYAFWNCTTITSITIPESVTSIEGSAFYGCSNLTSITCKAVTPPTIGNSNTFYNVDKSIPVYVPASSVESYKSAEYWSAFTNIQPIGTCGDNLTWRLTEEGELIIEGTGEMSGYSSGTSPWYEYRKSIKTVTISEGVTTIGEWAFYECNSLTSIIIPESVTSIGKSAFHSCSNLTRIDVPEGVVAIEGYAMCNCNSLTLITLPSSLIEIDAAAFNLSGNIIQFIIDEDNPVYTDYINNAIVEKDSKTLIAGTVYGGVPDSYGYKIEHIGDYAFCGRNIEGEFSIPDGVVSIGRYAFAASTISSIRIPKTLKKCEDGAFQHSFVGDKSDITRVYIDDLSAWLDIDFYGCDTNPLCNGASLYLKDELLASIVIPVGVTTIKRCAFAGWSGKEVLFPESVTSIEYEAFSGCSSLTSITCEATTPPTVGGSYTFSDVDKSIPLYVPAGSVNTYRSAEYWNEFTNIQAIPSSDIASGTCGDNLTWRLTEDGELIIEGTGAMYDFSSQGAPWFECRMSIKTVTIKEGATSIGDNAFQYCVYPTSITLPESVMSIGKYAFWWCASLASITIPESVTSIGYAAFAYCRRLTTITIPESSQLTLIGRGAFESTLLTSITIPKSVTSIGYSVFYSCSSLTTIVVAEGNTTYDSRNNCNAIIETNSNTLIAGCASTVIPEDVTSIDAWAFYNLDNLTTINIPECVTSIGECAFENCSSLTSITCEAITPPMIESTTFQNIDKTIPLYVPAASVAIYKSAQYWNEFTNILPLPITITINQYGSGTYSSPYALDFSNVKVLRAYVATGYNHITGEVTLLRVHTAEAGTGLLVKGTPGVTYEVPIIESTADHTLNLLVATLEKTRVDKYSSDGMYANYKYTVIKSESPEPLFYPFADGSSLSAGKAYLQLPKAWLPEKENFVIRYRFDEGETTGFDDEQVTIDNQSSLAEGESNMQLMIYDLMGRRVLSPKKGGIYIINGRKVVY